MTQKENANKSGSREKHHALQELLIVAIVFAIFVVSSVIHYIKPALGMTDIVTILAVGMIFGIILQETTKRAIKDFKPARRNDSGEVI